MAKSNKDVKQDLKEALLKKAVGYEIEEREAIAGKSGKAEKVRVIKRHVPPDLKAIERIEYLINSGKW